MAISAICNLLQLQSANVDRMHDEDVWPCSIPKTRGGPPSRLQRIEGGVAENRGWSCRASKVELQSIEGGVAERRRWSCRESRVELQRIEGGVAERRRWSCRESRVEVQRIEGGGAENRGWSCRASKVELQSVEGGVAERRRWSCRASRVELKVVVDRDAWCFKLQAGDCRAPGMAWHSILIKSARDHDIHCTCSLSG